MVRQSGLTQDTLDTLLAWLDPDRDAAGEKYERIRHTLMRFFEWRRCLPPDEHVDETIDRVARRIASGEQVRAADPRSYFYGVAKHVWQESQRMRPTVALMSEPHIDLAPDPPSQLECLRHCLAGLSADSRELFERYYLDGREGLAESMGITPNALRLRIFKEKQKLRGCVRRCLDSNEARRKTKRA